jgi:Flp pilus assembly protein TadD
LIVALCGGILLAGCTSAENRLLKESGLAAEDASFFPSDIYVRMGKVSFRNGSYGVAEENFRRAVEVSPRDAEAWVGLAASYDRLRRFDLADKAYERALKFRPDNAVLLNNAGFSKLMRGDIPGARRLLLRAYEIDPQNPYIANNIALLGESEKSVKRAAL